MFSVIPVSSGQIDRRFTTEQSRAVALRALGFLSNNQAYLERFVSATGISALDLRRQTVPRPYLMEILDFIIGNELMLLRFSRTADLPLEAAYEARRVLGGRSSSNRDPQTDWRTASKDGIATAREADRAS
jgi:hypothetical protein